MSQFNFHPQSPVVLTPCENYDNTTVAAALSAALEPLGGLSWVTSGMTVGIKANLVSAMKPEECATTHPSLLCALIKMLTERGAKVIVGDSPGGVYTAAFVNHVYHASGMEACEAAGALLNRDFSTTDTSFPEARVLKSFTYTAWLDACDSIIDFCKLKSHGMMGMSAAAKNLFGVIPGTMKPEYHFRFPNMVDFSHMLVDINDYFAEKIKLCLVDGVESMEGNGPTQGTPRHVGVLLASPSPHTVDAVCARLIGLTEDAVPTLMAARERGLIGEDFPLLIAGSPAQDVEDYAVSDFKHVAVRHGHLFDSRGKLISKALEALLTSRPKLKAGECIGCAKCGHICPAKAITMESAKNGRKRAVIDRDKCIRCFCCQEFCPTGAMKVHRTWIARMLVKSKK
ncbi:MAG: DUF362 domain-containing protein [Ruminococcaceae bacterium]|nr:DUF362 domain-containing protein [Oscillospiraceae bacterium]